jgi:carbonic anhydrase
MIKKLTLIILLLMALAACSTSVPEEITELLPDEGESTISEETALEETADEPVEEPQSEEQHHWGYGPDNGPDKWAEEYALCGDGRLQSPIALPDAQTPTLMDISYNYQENDFTITNNGHTIQVDFVGGNGGNITIQNGDDASTYTLKQFHFHAPSEHTVGSFQYPIEMHLVHQSDAGDLAVVGVFFEQADIDNAAFADVWGYLPELMEHDAEVASTTRINAANLLPEQHSLYRYTGSLTTPTQPTPCREGIIWSVLNTPVQLSAQQISAFTQIYSGNNRPTQALKDHVVQVSGAESETETTDVPAEVAITECSTEDIPDPRLGGEATLRFVNSSGTIVTVLWNNTTAGSLVPYAQLSTDQSFEQETYIGHEWVLNDQFGNTLLEYTATADIRQCVLIAQP